MSWSSKKSKLNKAKAQFKAVTGASDSIADELCKMHKNDSARAIDYFFQNRHRYPSAAPKAKKADEKQLSTLFDSYAGEDEEDKDSMFEEKFGEYCSKIGISFEGMEPIALAYLLKASTPGEISRQEFVKGWSALGKDTIADMKSHIATELSSLKNNKSSFKKFYLWSFTYFLEGDKKQQDCEVACEIWNAVLVPRWELGKKWVAWAGEQDKIYKDKAQRGGLPCISADVWGQILEFSIEVKADLSNWEDDGAYPTAIDDFVEHLQEG